MTSSVRMRGIAASPGIAIAPVRVVDREKIKIPRFSITALGVQLEIDRLRDALAESRMQLEAARNAVRGPDSKVRVSDHSLILDAHLLMLDDELLIHGTHTRIRDQLINAEWAMVQTLEEIKETLASTGDDYFRDRAEDFDFVGERVLRNLMGHVTEIVGDDRSSCVVVAASLSPAETTQMIGSLVLGFATEAGTRTSHTAIMAQALGIPAVVGVERLAERVAAGDTVIIDGNEGVVIIRPEPATVADYRSRALRHAEQERRLLATRDDPALTVDGTRLALFANIEFPAEAAVALDFGAEGIGLYRTEFLYLDRSEPPDEEEQYRTYRAVVEALTPRPLVFRTFDLGADKISPDAVLHERNPALGLRAIRLGLKHRSMFKTQLCALLRAARHGAVHIMFPMVSGVGELRQVKALLEEAWRDLGDDAPERTAVRVGCMIELPSAVFAADKLAKEVDFFSIGTNDLIQYSLAIDRGNDHVAYLYTPYHPAILNAVRMVVGAGRTAGIPVSMCGNMAAEPLLVPLLIGMGLRNLSMAATLIPKVKAIVCRIDCSEAEELTLRALDLATATEVEDLVRDYVETRLGRDLLKL